MDEYEVKESLKRVKHGDLLAMNKLIEAKANIDLGYIFLNACENDQMDIALACMEQKPDVVNTIRKEDGYTCLHLIAKRGYNFNTYLMRMLLFSPPYSNLININVPDILGRYPIFLIAESRHSFIQEMLDLKSVAWEVQDTMGRNLIQLACWYSNIDLFDLLLKTKRYLADSVDSFGRTVLHTICSLGNVEMFRIIKTALPSYRFISKDMYGLTPFHIACQHSHLSIIKEMSNMIEILPSLNLIDKDGLTPLASAVVCRRPDVVEILLASSLPFKFHFDKPIYQCNDLLSLASVFPNESVSRLLASNFALIREKYLSDCMNNECVIIYDTDINLVKVFKQENARVKFVYFVKDEPVEVMQQLKDLFLEKQIKVYLLKDSTSVDYVRSQGINVELIEDPFMEATISFVGLAELKLREEQMGEK